MPHLLIWLWGRGGRNQIVKVMKTKHAEDLAKEYDFNTKDEYFNYIVDSLINGQRQQVKTYF